MADRAALTLKIHEKPNILLKRHSIASSRSSNSGQEHCYDVLLEKNQRRQSDATVFDTLKYSLSLPPHGEIGSVLTWLLLLPMLWVILYSITGKEALPGGNLFSIASILLLAQIGGYITSFLKLPPLLGMLLVGIAVRSLPGVDIIGNNIDYKWSATLRKMALVIILIKAGLGLDPKALKELALTVLRVGIIPNVTETCIVAVVSHFLLGFPWLWSFMLGFVMAGVSPSVVVPCILGLSDEGYGLDKGIPTLIIAGLSVDNVISISGFGVMLGIHFSGGSIVYQAFKGPIEIACGLAFGCLMGRLLWYFPNRKTKGFAKFRFVLLFAAGMFAVFGSKKIGFAGCGPLGCLATAFVAALGWRKEGWMTPNCPVKKTFNFLWKFFLPLLFSLIGSEIKISALDGNTVGYGLATIFTGMIFRFGATFVSVLGGKLNMKERVFVAISWLPKATIQAAIGSAALDAARHANVDPVEESADEILGKQLLTIAVLGILVAAPIGAAVIMLSGPKLLEKLPPEYTEVSTSEKTPQPKV